jgi:hypothetical protein
MTLTMIDVVDALYLGRTYRNGLGLAKAPRDIPRNKRILHDIDAVDAWLRLFTERGYRFHNT